MGTGGAAAVAGRTDGLEHLPGRTCSAAGSLAGVAVGTGRKKACFEVMGRRADRIASVVVADGRTAAAEVVACEQMWAGSKGSTELGLEGSTEGSL